MPYNKNWLRLPLPLVALLLIVMCGINQPPGSSAGDATSCLLAVSVEPHLSFRRNDSDANAIKRHFVVSTINNQEVQDNRTNDERIPFEAVLASSSIVNMTMTRASSELQTSSEINKALHESKKLVIETVWRRILHGLPNATSRNVLEIGMHTAKQCLQAARAGFDAHCIEPSPTSFARVIHFLEKGNRRRFKTEVVNQPWLLKKQNTTLPPQHYPIHLYNVAAGNSSGQRVYFHSSGSTGDHVVSESMASHARVTQVMSLRMDDLIQHLDSNILVMKLDVQGFEPTVLEGLVESLSLHRIDFLLMEVWPKGMQGECGVALQRLRDAGYTLYPLYNLIGHPITAPKERHTITERPYTTLKAFCDWYVHLEDRLVAPNNTLGFWTDLVAVSPRVINGQEGLAHEFWSTFLSQLS